jgi:hypothetical protein
MAKIFGVHTPAELKNLIINGGLDFWQHVQASTTTVNTSSGAGAYTADMVSFSSGGTTVKNYSIVQSTDAPSLAQSGFQSSFSYLFTMITGIASPAAGDAVEPFLYKMEGFDYEKIHTKTVTFGFWCKTSVGGTYSLALRNSAGNRSYVTTFTQSAATWQYQTITITLDNTGTWLFNSGIGLQIDIGAITGTTFQTSTLNAWQGGLFISASTATNYQATAGATLQVAQLALVEGPLGLGATGFARNSKSIASELASCQRYCVVYDNFISTQTNAALSLPADADSTTNGNGFISFPVPMRVIPIYTAQGAASDYAWRTTTGTSVNLTSLPAFNSGRSSEKMAFLSGTTGATLVSGTSYYLTNNNGNSRLVFDAGL